MLIFEGRDVKAFRQSSITAQYAYDSQLLLKGMNHGLYELVDAMSEHLYLYDTVRCLKKKERFRKLDPVSV